MDYKKTTTVKKRHSMMDNLSDDELLELKEWKESSSFIILCKLVEQQRLYNMAQAVKSANEMGNMDTLIKGIYKYIGAMEEDDRILALPDLAYDTYLRRNKK